MNTRSIWIRMALVPLALAACGHSNADAQQRPPSADDTAAYARDNAAVAPAPAPLAQSDSSQAAGSSISDTTAMSPGMNSATADSNLRNSNSDAAASGAGAPGSSGGLSASTGESVAPGEPAEAASDSTPTPGLDAAAALQRLQAYNRGEMPIGAFMAKHGGVASAKYGARLHRDRRAAASAVDKVASTLGVSVWPFGDASAAKELADDQATLASLKKLRGAELDRVFARHMIEDRQEAVDVARQVRTSCGDAQVRALIDQLLPGIEDELARARALPAGSASAAND